MRGPDGRPFSANVVKAPELVDVAVHSRFDQLGNVYPSYCVRFMWIPRRFVRDRGAAVIGGSDVVASTRSLHVSWVNDARIMIGPCLRQSHHFNCKLLPGVQVTRCL